VIGSSYIPGVVTFLKLTVNDILFLVKFCKLSNLPSTFTLICGISLTTSKPSCRSLIAIFTFSNTLTALVSVIIPWNSTN